MMLDDQLVSKDKYMKENSLFYLKETLLFKYGNDVYILFFQLTTCILFFNNLAKSFYYFNKRTFALLINEIKLSYDSKTKFLFGEFL